MLMSLRHSNIVWEQLATERHPFEFGEEEKGSVEAQGVHFPFCTMESKCTPCPAMLE
jgi:hypothetical protein